MSLPKTAKRFYQLSLLEGLVLGIEHLIYNASGWAIQNGSNFSAESLAHSLMPPSTLPSQSSSVASSATSVDPELASVQQQMVGASSAPQTSSSASSVSTITNQQPNIGLEHFHHNLAANYIPFMQNAIKITLLIGTAFLIAYGVSLYLRHRNGQQRPLHDDWDAYQLRNRLIRALGLNYSSDKKKKLSDDQRRVDQALRKIKVTEYTENNKTNYMVEIPVPLIEEVNNRLKARLKNFDRVITRENKGKVVFGQMQTSTDLSTYYFSATEELPIKKKDVNSESTPKKIKEDWTYPLDLYTDRRDEIETKRVALEAWAENQADLVNGLFTTKGIPVEFESSYCSATTVQLSYSLKTVNNLPNIEPFESEIDNRLGLMGTSINLRKGKLNVILQVPRGDDNDLTLPIDMRTILENTWGEKEPLDPTDALFGMTPDGSYINHAISGLPHMMAAGTTGSGKTVSINMILISMMAHAKPEDLNLALVDPKKVEFSMYAGLPYMIADPITDMDKALNLAKFLVSEMERRNSLMAEAGVKNLPELRKYEIEQYGKAQTPFLLAVFDEYADLVGEHKEVEKPLQRILQKGRSAGIHVILATQTPNAEIFPRLLKANIPARLALKTGDQIESQIILDEPGAEKLAGKGDSLLKTNGNPITRLQGVFISNDEINRIFSYLREHYEAASPVDLDQYSDDEETKSDGTELQSSPISLKDLSQKRESTQHDFSDLLLANTPIPDTEIADSLSINNLHSQDLPSDQEAPVLSVADLNPDAVQNLTNLLDDSVSDIKMFESLVTTKDVNVSDSADKTNQRHEHEPQYDVHKPLDQSTNLKTSATKNADRTNKQLKHSHNNSNVTKDSHRLSPAQERRKKLMEKRRKLRGEN